MSRTIHLSWKTFSVARINISPQETALEAIVHNRQILVGTSNHRYESSRLQITYDIERTPEVGQDGLSAVLQVSEENIAAHPMRLRRYDGMTQAQSLFYPAVQGFDE